MSISLLPMLVGHMLVVSLSGANCTARVEAANSTDPIGSWMKRHKMAVRKIFDGSKEEQNPASIFFIREPTGKDREFSSIDVAVKVTEFSFFENSPSTSVLLFPVADYHRSTNSDKLQNQLGISARTEFRPVGLASPHDSRCNTRPGTWWPVAPTFLMEAKAARDWQKKARMTKYSVQVFPTTEYRFGPGATWRNGQDTPIGQYYPYAGVERYSFSGPARDTVAIVGLARLWVEYWPLTTPTWQILQITADITSRHRLSGDESVPSQLSDATFAANLYLDPNGHVGLGIDYANGRDAAQRFVRRERTRLALKVKF